MESQQKNWPIVNWATIKLIGAITLLRSHYHSDAETGTRTVAMTVRMPLYVCGTLIVLNSAADRERILLFVCIWGWVVLGLGGTTFTALAFEVFFVSILNWSSWAQSISKFSPSVPGFCWELCRRRKMMKGVFLETFPSLTIYWTPALTRLLLTSWDGVTTLAALSPQFQHRHLSFFSLARAHFRHEAEGQQVSETAFEQNLPQTLHCSTSLNLSVSSGKKACSFQCLQSDLAASNNLTNSKSTLKSVQVISERQEGQVLGSSLSTQLRQAVRWQQLICNTTVWNCKVSTIQVVYLHCSLSWLHTEVTNHHPGSGAGIKTPPSCPFSDHFHISKLKCHRERLDLFS